MAFRLSDRDRAASQAAAAIRQANRAQADYDALMPQAMAKISQAQHGPSNPLESVLSGIGNSVKNLGTGLMDLFGTGGAAVGDAIESIRTGKVTTKNEDDYRKWLYDTDSVKDAATKGLGTGLDAAATLTDFIPGLGTGAKIALNVGQGVASGAANPLIEKGSQATLEDVMRGAAVGGASAGVGQYVGGKLAGRTAGKGAISKALNSNIGKAALTGAASGAAGGGLNAALSGGDLGQTLGGAWQGAQGGALAGGTMAGTMGLIGTGIDKLNQKYGAEAPTNAPVARRAPVANNTEAEPVNAATRNIEAPTRRAIDVQYDGEAEPVNVNRRVSNQYRLAKGSGSTLDGVLGPNNKTKLPNALPDTRSQFRRLFGDDTSDISAAVKNGLLDASGDDAISGDAVLKDILDKNTYDQLRAATRDYADYSNSSLDGYGVSSKSQLPKIKTSDYIEATGYKGQDIPEYMRPFLSEENGRSLKDSSWSQIMPQYNNEGQFTGTPDDVLQMYDDLAGTNRNVTYTNDNLVGALETNPDLYVKATEQVLADSYPTRKIDVDKRLPLGLQVDVDTPDSRPLIRDVRPATRQAQPQVQAQPIRETPTPRTPAQPVADEPIAVTDRAEFDRRYKADNYRTKAAQRTLAQFGNVDAPAKRSAKAIETAKFMNGLDLFKKGDIDYAAETVTGRNGAIAQAVTKAAQDADPVKINFKNVSEGVQRGLATSSLTDAKKKAVATSINAYNERLSSLANPDGTISPNDVLNTIRNVESDAATLLGKDGSTYRRPTSTDTRMAHVLQDYARDLQDIVDDNVNIKGVITPELSAQLKNAQPGNQKWAEWVDKTLDGAKTVKDLRKAQAPFVRMARFAENAEAQSTNNLPTTKSAILNQAVAGIVNSNDALARRAQYNAKKADAVMAGNPNGVRGKIGDVAKNIASKAGKAAEMFNNDTFSGREISPIARQGQTQTIGDVAARQLSRQAGLGAMQQQDRQNAIQNAAQEAQDVQSNYENSMLQAQQAYAQAQQMPTTQGSETLDRVSRAMDLALAAGNLDAYSQLADLYKQAYGIYQLQNPTASSTNGQSDAKALTANQTKALTGLQQLQSLSGMQPGLGTALASSPLGGVVNMFGGDDYANQAQSLALTLGYLQSGANITPREAESIGRAYIPTAYDSENVRQNKLSRAEQLLRNYLADTSALQQ